MYWNCLFYLNHEILKIFIIILTKTVNLLLIVLLHERKLFKIFPMFTLYNVSFFEVFSKLTHLTGNVAKLYLMILIVPCIKTTFALELFHLFFCPGPPFSSDGVPRRALRGDGALLIRPVNESTDVGRYSCSASNAQGRTSSVAFFLNILSE